MGSGMARRRRNSTFEDLTIIASRLPWWLCLVLAALAWLGLHALAVRQIAPPTPPINLSSIMIEQMVKGVASFAQYIVPLLLVVGAFVSAAKRWQRRTLLDSVADGGTASSVRSLTWQQFEQLTGEALRRQGFQVSENVSQGADGGIDLRLFKGGEKYLVQCKQWRAFKVGVGVVRELYGVMAAEGATGGFVVTSGSFTKEAYDFAQGRNVELVDGKVLEQWIQATRNVGPTNPDSLVEREVAIGSEVEITVSCPRCRAPMVRRMAKRGPNAGGSFWGCSHYPKCRGTLTL